MSRGLAVGLYKKKTRKLAVHAGGSGHDGREKRNVLIVSLLLSIDFCAAQRDAGGRRGPGDAIANLLLHVAAASDPVMCDGQVED